MEFEKPDIAYQVWELGRTFSGIAVYMYKFNTVTEEEKASVIYGSLAGTKGFNVIDEDGKNVVVWESDILEIKEFPH